MDPRSQKYLDEILSKSPGELIEDEIRFLRARISYLKDSQVEEYKSVLETKPAVKQTVKNAKKES